MNVAAGNCAYVAKELRGCCVPQCKDFLCFEDGVVGAREDRVAVGQDAVGATAEKGDGSGLKGELEKG